MPRMIVTVKRLNRRNGPIANVADKTNVIDVVTKGFAFDSIDETQNAAGTWYKDNFERYYWGGGLMVDITTVTIVPAETSAASFSAEAATSSLDNSTSEKLLKAPVLLPSEMPLSKTNCIKYVSWMKDNFGGKINAAVQNTPFDAALVYAIACQETAQRWGFWIKDFSAETILKRCVFDASGDITGTIRSAFPKNKAEMITNCGERLTQMLVDEANAMRAMPQPGYANGFQPAGYLYKGYGIFQYDLQHIQTDRDFFENKMWYSIDACINRLLKELNIKFNAHTNDMYATIRAYNGSGLRAEHYAQKVSQFYTWIVEI